MKYYDGTVFNAGCEALVNTVNTDGFMGKGIALEFALRYKGLESCYKAGCETGDIRVNKVHYYYAEGVTIINFPTKMHFKFPSRLEWIDAALADFVKTYKSKGIKSVAFPRLGCANGGLNWEDVKPIMEKHLSGIDIPVVICLDNKSVAEGKELDMVTAFNKTEIDDLAGIIRLNEKQKETLNRAKPINRFWKLGDLAGIGTETYKKLFKHFYEDNGVQMSLFN